MKTYSIIQIATIFIVLFFTSMSANALTITAASPELVDVQKAITAARSGDTVIVPAGTATWPTNLIITFGITLKGAGQGNTTIISGFDAPTPGNTFIESNYLVLYRPANNTLNEAFRITGFTFDFNNRTSGILLKNLSSIRIDKIRIDNNTIKNATFLNGSARAVQIHGTVYGVVDSNQFSGNYICIDSYGVNATSWNNLDFNYGSPECMYYEDNTFSISNAPHMAGAGGRYCVRYNTYNHDAATNLYPWLDMHGNMGTGGNYGTMGVEVYGNKLISSLNKSGGIFDHRGGKAVIFSNKVVSTGVWSAKTREEWDDDHNPTANPQPQHVSDSYYWNNRYGNNVLVKTIIANNTAVLYPLQENVDFYTQNITFNGTTGIGCGPLASRPKTCTPGASYWATDQSCTSIDDASVGANPAVPLSGVLYKCTALNTWTFYYTPYTYPHPLRAVSTSASSDTSPTPTTTPDTSSTTPTASTTPTTTPDTSSTTSTTTSTPSTTDTGSTTSTTTSGTTTGTSTDTSSTTSTTSGTTTTTSTTSDSGSTSATSGTTSTTTTDTTTKTTPPKSKRRW